MDALWSLLGTILTNTWWLIVPFLLFLGFQQYRKRVWVQNQRYVLLRVSVPKENDKAPVAAEQMFAALHGIARDANARFFEGSTQEHIGFEIVSQKNRINFYVYAPENQKSFVEGQIYAQYPKADIKKVHDYVIPEDYTGRSVAGTELKLTNKDAYPIKTFLNFEDVDPLSGVTAVMSDLAEGEEVWIQLLARPADDKWRRRSESELNRLQSGSSGPSVGKGIGAVGGFAGELFRAATTPPQPAGKPAGPPPKPVQVDEAISSGIRDKSAKLGYETKVRIVAVSSDSVKARNRLNSAIGAFKQYNTTNLNGFVAAKISNKADTVVTAYRARAFTGKGPILNIEELASLWHLPNTSVETPTISWTTSSKGEPPENIPLEENEQNLTIFAETNFRDKVRRFGLKPDDRRRHIYAIGKTGMGKTNMLENMVISDMKSGRGLAVVDPHGDFVETVLDHVPADRVDDVVVFNPADRAYPIAFNIMEKVDRDAKPLVASGIVGVFEKIYGHSWGPRLEYILRNTILALLDYPDSTLLDVPRMLADDKFRKKAVEHIEDPVVRDYWTNEFANYTERQRVEAIAPIQNKVGQFLSSTTIRNVVGQKRSAINLRELMDNGKIVLFKLSKGELGEDSSALLGAMLITKIQLAAMSRADIHESERRDFYLYVDEFQNFATQSFASILSEARKYRLNLAMANQYVAQMPEEVRDAVFGNVGTLISFRVGAQDADWLVKEMEPVFTETDIVNLDKFHIYLKMAIDGVTGDAFSAKTIPLPPETTAFRQQILDQSRERYASSRETVEQDILATAGGMFGGPDAAAEDDDKKRRFQSYLDKERVFAERLKDEQGSKPAKEAGPSPKPAAREATHASKSTKTHQPSHKKTETAPKQGSKRAPLTPATHKPAAEKPAPAPKPAARPEPASKPASSAPAGEIPAGDLDEDVVIKF